MRNEKNLDNYIHSQKNHILAMEVLKKHVNVKAFGELYIRS